LDEFLILLSNGRTFSLGAFQEKLISIGAQFIEVIVFDVIEVGFFKIFQNRMRGQVNEFMTGGHH
jgi:hypothetical protein